MHQIRSVISQAGFGWFQPDADSVPADASPEQEMKLAWLVFVRR